MTGVRDVTAPNQGALRSSGKDFSSVAYGTAPGELRLRCFSPYSSACDDRRSRKFEQALPDGGRRLGTHSFCSRRIFQAAAGSASGWREIAPVVFGPVVTPRSCRDPTRRAFTQRYRILSRLATLSRRLTDGAASPAVSCGVCGSRRAGPAFLSGLERCACFFPSDPLAGLRGACSSQRSSVLSIAFKPIAEPISNEAAGRRADGRTDSPAGPPAMAPPARTSGKASSSA